MSISISVLKNKYASLGEQTIGSPLTLKEVLIRVGHPVKSLNALSNL